MPKSETPAAIVDAVTAPKPATKVSKLDRLVALLTAPDGAAMPQLIEATDWQAHSIRGAMAGALRRKGFTIESAKTDAGRRWRIVPAPSA